MELYAASVVACDPFRVAEALRERGSGSTAGAARPVGDGETNLLEWEEPEE
jgi:hypothetical protein